MGAVSPKAARRGEFDLIASVLAPLAAGDGRALDLKDDAAILPQTTGLDTVVSTDTLVAGIHFLIDEPADVIARRLLRVNLSDIAAMAAEPTGYFLNLTLPPETDDEWLRNFAKGLAADQDVFGIRLWGGDTTTTSGSLTLSVTLFGEVPSGTAVQRSTARNGDRVFVSGTIGDAGLGLSRLSDGGENTDPLIMRYQRPTPRVALGQELRGVASAMADVSDGLVADLGHICTASGVSAVIEADRIPLSVGAKAELVEKRTAFDRLLTSGDDYELIFTAPTDRQGDVEAAAARADVVITEIGHIAEGKGSVTVLDGEGRELPLKTAGYRHF